MILFLLLKMKMLDLLNNFDINLNFKVDIFENEVQYFMVLEVCPDGLSISLKS